jgi:uncharacterized protein YndB with AHSA1/START domain
MKKIRMNNNITGKASITIDAPKNEVWDALTNPDQIRKYFFGTEAVSDWKKGSPIYFRGEWEGKKYEDKGTILETKPGELFKYSYWSSMSGIEDKPENYVVVSYLLSEDQGKTKVTITQENIPDEKMKAHSEENWNKVLGDLKNLLEHHVAAY